MTTQEKLEQIRAYAITARTAIYNEDAMTAIELAGVTACKVNECVKAINDMLDVLETIHAEHTSARLLYSEADEGLQIV